MAMYLVIRDGQVKMPLTDPTIKADGTIWMRGAPLLGITDATSKTRAADAVRRRAWDEIPADAYTRIGDNANGLTVVKQSEYLAATEAALTPAQRERREINNLYARAERIANSDSEDNVSGQMMLRARAGRLLADWRAKYPAEAAAERRAEMLDKAAHLRDMARGALTCDMDGWITTDEQQRRHDDYISQAKAIEAAAKMSE